MIALEINQYDLIKPMFAEIPGCLWIVAVMEERKIGNVYAYLVIMGIGIIGLLLSFFIKQVGQASEKESEMKLKKIIAEEA
ncbi:hypothetical protein [Paenibacillus sp. URB8-2]|uniref:hypothetical protein n=1 Tax=Paenibacillus sp. URB8-2 TaxID=2741301 RepID=UPI0015C0E44F|nr:hypothetical protein [Paenibacillus sp. URB8-2]BCG59280.1 hypothetical protein PUR_27050 [Paenibacillus sp. URB8-2]